MGCVDWIVVDVWVMLVIVIGLNKLVIWYLLVVE